MMKTASWFEKASLDIPRVKQLFSGWARESKKKDPKEYCEDDEQEDILADPLVETVHDEVLGIMLEEVEQEEQEQVDREQDQEEDF